MKNCNILKREHGRIISALFGVILMVTLNSCASNWFLTPREKSIKEWESKQKDKELYSDSIQTIPHIEYSKGFKVSK